MTIDGWEVDGGQDESLPGVEMTGRFLALCDRYGSDRGAVAVVARGAAGRGVGLAGA